MKFFHKETNDIRKENRTHCFYIPIVEQIKEDAPNWSLAKQELRIRKFYSCPESLKQAESARLASGSRLACYKVMLSDTERQQLTVSSTKSTAYSGFLHFNATEILSLILFKPGNQLELTNPDYHQEANTILVCGA